LPLILLPVQFISSMNFYDVIIEKETIPYRFLQKVKETAIPGQPPPTMQGYSGRELRWAWLNYHNQTELGVVQWSAHPGHDADFQIIYPEKNPAWQQHYDSIDSDNHSGLYLVERKHKLKKNPAEQSVITPIGPSNDEFLGISDGSLDSLTGSTIYATYGLWFKSSKKHITAWIVFAVMDKDDNLLRYERLPLNWYNRDWRMDDRLFINGLLIFEIPENAVKYTTYIWNMYKAEAHLEGGNFKLSKLEKDY
ncbi:MAG: hypothetical protein JW731_08840, partial [Bacteroidales bacterium]|nr:hypothetical protein [Bacteroidales bacterium]